MKFTFTRQVWVTALPVFIIQGNSRNPHYLIPTDIIGSFIWFVGIATEATADHQKQRWRKDPRNKGQFIDVGLWSRARYPNYVSPPPPSPRDLCHFENLPDFEVHACIHISTPSYTAQGGEVTLWSGLFIFCAGIMHGAQFATVVSPLFVAFLLIKVSGVPIQEKQGLERWGDRTDYQDYRSRTWLLFPLPFRPWGARPRQQNSIA